MKFNRSELINIINPKIKNKTFIFYKVSEDNYNIFFDLIIKNGGIVKTILTKKIDFVITESVFDKNIEKILVNKIDILHLIP